MILEQTK